MQAQVKSKYLYRPQEPVVINYIPTYFRTGLLIIMECRTKVEHFKNYNTSLFKNYTYLNKRQLYLFMLT